MSLVLKGWTKYLIPKSLSWEQIFSNLKWKFSSFLLWTLLITVRISSYSYMRSESFGIASRESRDQKPPDTWANNHYPFLLRKSESTQLMKLHWLGFKVFFLKFYFIFSYMYVCIYATWGQVPAAQKKASDPLEVGLQADVSCLMQVLETEFRSSKRTVNTLNQWGFSAV